MIKFALKKFINPNGKDAFINILNKGTKILDVGCGNKSSFWFKNIRPDITYYGIDIELNDNCADYYITTKPELFHTEIGKFFNFFDGCISSHNLEHCNHRQDTLLAMLNCIKKNGLLYLSFPSEESIYFPSRFGTLNYYDDSTHNYSPPNFNEIIGIIENNGFVIIKKIKNNKPFVLRNIGRIFEIFSNLNNKMYLGTSEYYGFESIIWAIKK